MHQFAQNCACNARKLLAAGDLPQTPLGELMTTLPETS